jgi:hypothetical protein
MAEFCVPIANLTRKSFGDSQLTARSAIDPTSVSSRLTLLAPLPFRAVQGSITILVTFCPCLAEFVHLWRLIESNAVRNYMAGARFGLFRYAPTEASYSCACWSAPFSAKNKRRSWRNCQERRSCGNTLDIAIMPRCETFSLSTARLLLHPLPRLGLPAH